jgi:hypothetical protein
LEHINEGRYCENHIYFGFAGFDRLLKATISFLFTAKWSENSAVSLSRSGRYQAVGGPVVSKNQFSLLWRPAKKC